MAFRAARPATIRGGRRRCHTLRLLLTVWTAVVYSGVRVAHCVSLSTMDQLAQPRVEPAVFSSQWATGYAAKDVGCQSARGSYMWRPQGFGSNLNNMLNAWVYALAVERWSDLSVVIAPNQLEHIECSEESRGEASTGWDCLFSPMPNLCTFHDAEGWTDYMAAMNVSREDVGEASRLDQDTVRFHPEKIAASLQGLAVDHEAALGVMAKYLWSFMTPWMREELDLITRAAKAEAFEKSPYIGLHIRRGDKILMHEAGFHGAEEYLSAAVAYLEEDVDAERTSVDKIKGIWVASDDPAVLDEVRAAAPTYFPKVKSDAVIMVSSGVPGGPDAKGMQTRTEKQTYSNAVYMFADFHQLAKADVFVCTFSSNVGRLVALLRESDSSKTRDSTISLDVDSWWPGRRNRDRVR